jgi:hypothetical protein
MDFGFMQSSSEDYNRSNKAKDHVIMSYAGYSSHLVIVDGTFLLGLGVLYQIKRTSY